MPKRESRWTESIAVGGSPFIERIKKAMGAMAKGRCVQPGNQPTNTVPDAGSNGGIIRGMANSKPTPSVPADKSPFQRKF